MVSPEANKTDWMVKREFFLALYPLNFVCLPVVLWENIVYGDVHSTKKKERKIWKFDDRGENELEHNKGY